MSADTAAFDSYLARWRALEPEMQFAEPFVPSGLRPRFRAWGVLLTEIESSALALSEAHLAAARLAWWAEELQQRAPRHPVCVALRGSGVDDPRPAAASVALAALALTQREDAVADTPAAVAALRGFGAAVARVEALLFDDGADARGAGMDIDGAARAVAVGTLGRWLPRAAERPLVREHLPLHLLARHAVAARDATAGPAHRGLVRDTARELLEIDCAPARLTLYRAIRWGYDRARLARFASGRLPQPGRPVPAPLRATVMAWRSARSARW